MKKVLKLQKLSKKNATFGGGGGGESVLSLLGHCSDSVLSLLGC
jgi:hypothetical protein